MGMLDVLNQAMADPFHFEIVPATLRCIVVCLFVYGVVVLVLVSDRMNFRRGEEYGSARWANPLEIDRKYRDRKSPENNLILTRHVTMGNCEGTVRHDEKMRIIY